MGVSRGPDNRRSRPSPRRPQRQGRWDGQGSRRWWVAVALLVVLAILLAWALVQSRRPAMAPDEVGCSSMEQVTYHVHAHLAILVDGQPVVVPANIGIRATCITWLHTHATDGIIHIEAPSPHTYPLGAFLQVWGQPLPTLDQAGQPRQMVAYVNGRPWDRPVATIPLTAHAVIVLEYGLPFVPPSSYTFPPGL